MTIKPISAEFSITQAEFRQRVLRCQEELNKSGLDGVLIHSNEAEMAGVRYFSDFWPIFEAAGVFIPATGEPALLVGPESETFARGRSAIQAIYTMIEYREPADPDYPGLAVTSFADVFRKHCRATPQRLGIVGWTIFPMPVMEGLRAALPNTDIVQAEHVVRVLRAVKSPAEIACLAEAFRISELALAAVVKSLRVGISELELVGVAQQVMYANGAEYEGHPPYILSGPKSSDAISRPQHRLIKAGEMIQLNIGARVGGYSSSVGRPACIGKMPAQLRELSEFGLEAHHWTYKALRPGVQAAEIASTYEAWVRSRGMAEYLLYGPCHGLGIIEVEPPWIEKSSTYTLQPGMTFQADTFFQTPAGSRLAVNGRFGLRWEDGVVITDSGNRLLSGADPQIIEVAA
jgi:Xaa-Pro aminopeptidase